MTISPRTSKFSGKLHLFQNRGIHLQRDRANGLHVGRYVFAGRAIAARQAPRTNLPPRVLQRNAQAIELVFSDVLDLLASRFFRARGGRNRASASYEKALSRLNMARACCTVCETVAGGCLRRERWENRE